MPIRKTTKKRLRHGIENGYKSGLEELNAKLLDEKGVPYEYETLKIRYLIPAKWHTYKPDFILLDNGIIVETKGKFELDDRNKHIEVKKQHPDLDIRFVFSSPNQKIYKGSKTSYAMWADNNGFKWAAKTIPDAWLHEPRRSI